MPSTKIKTVIAFSRFSGPTPPIVEIGHGVRGFVFMVTRNGIGSVLERPPCPSKEISWPPYIDTSNYEQKNSNKAIPEDKKLCRPDHLFASLIRLCHHLVCRAKFKNTGRKGEAEMEMVSDSNRRVHHPNDHGYPITVIL